MAALMLGTALALVAMPADAQRPHRQHRGQGAETAAPQGALGLPPAPVDAAPVPLTGAATGTVPTIAIVGAQRLEPDTVRSYIKLHVGDTYSREALDQALKDLYATELFADVQIKDEG